VIIENLYFTTLLFAVAIPRSA